MYEEKDKRKWTQVSDIHICKSVNFRDDFVAI